MAAADRQDARKSMMLEQPISKIIPKMAIPTIVVSLSKALKKIQGIRGESFSLLSRLRVKDNQRYLSFERALLNNQRSTLLDPLACDDKHKGK